MDNVKMLLDEAGGAEKYYNLLKDETPKEARLRSFKKVVCKIFKYRHEIMSGCKNIARKTMILDKCLNRYHYFIDDDRVSYGMFDELGDKKEDLLGGG
jgi:hypothetical protein